MATKLEVLIAEAFSRHRYENHSANFEVCKDPQCAYAAREEARMLIFARNWMKAGCEVIASTVKSEGGN